MAGASAQNEFVGLDGFLAFQPECNVSKCGIRHHLQQIDIVVALRSQGRPDVRYLYKFLGIDQLFPLWCVNKKGKD